MDSLPELTNVVETLQDAAEAITSKSVQRAIVNTALLTSGATTLLSVAAIASALFFQNYVPDQVVSRPIHLQYGSGANPYGLVSLSSPFMKTQQPYDLSVKMTMPKSQANMERGNFMISIALLDQSVDSRLAASARLFADKHEDFGSHKVLFESRRPALIPFVDPMISLANRVIFVFYHILFPESHYFEMHVPLAERVRFSPVVGIPSAAYIEVEGGQTMQVHKAWLTMTAQLRGLRWLMYHYRTPTYLVFTFMFWMCEVIFMTAAWMAWTVMTTTSDGGVNGSPDARQARIKAGEDNTDEEEDGARDHDDRPHNFPTYGRQPPLKHEPVKRESKTDQRRISDIPAFGAEADDEDESENEGRISPSARDSGLGTSYSEEGGSSVRRQSKLSRDQ